MDPSSPASGAVRAVNSYQITDKLGAGGMGVVYKALDTRLDRIVALKFLPPELEADEKTRTQFLREARAASALDHPNVGTVHAIEETAEGVSFIVMAYYDGETLAQRIRHGPLPQAQAISIALQMARGLAEAHSHNIIHRDIKSSNAIITRQGVVKIVDFGLARAIQSASATLSTEISGSAAYMSPEQALGKPLDQRTDLWSLGVVLYEMLTGRFPFQGDTMPAMLMGVVNSPPAPLADVPVELQEVVYHALAKDPARRYQTAIQLLADLEKLETGGDRTNTRTLKKTSELKQYVESAAQSAFSPPVAAGGVKRRWLAAALAVPLAGGDTLAPSSHAAADSSRTVRPLRKTYCGSAFQRYWKCGRQRSAGRRLDGESHRQAFQSRAGEPVPMGCTSQRGAAPQGYRCFGCSKGIRCNAGGYGNCGA